MHLLGISHVRGGSGGRGGQGVATPSPNGQSHSIKCNTADMLSHANTLIYIAVVIVVSSIQVVKPLSRQAVVQSEVLHLLECRLGLSTVSVQGN